MSSAPLPSGAELTYGVQIFNLHVTVYCRGNADRRVLTLTAARFRLALELTKGPDWRPFEELASAFVMSQYPNIRPMGTASGDEGRDSEVFAVDGNPRLLFQFSVRVDWATKINQTLKRIKGTFPDAQLLTYVTNQQVGAKA